MSQQQDPNYSIFTALYCANKTSAGWNDDKFAWMNKPPHNHPEAMEKCCADLENGTLMVDFLHFLDIDDTSLSVMIPHQSGGGESRFFACIPFCSELERIFETAGNKSVYTLWDYDTELYEERMLRIFTANKVFDEVEESGWSDGLRIERWETFASLVYDSFWHVYFNSAKYHPCYKRRYNPLKGVTEAIFQGKIEGPQAEIFQSIFSAPSCRRTIIQCLWDGLEHLMNKTPERFVEAGLD